MWNLETNKVDMKLGGRLLKRKGEGGKKER
jgi:hypothetical protein